MNKSTWKGCNNSRVHIWKRDKIPGQGTSFIGNQSRRFLFNLPSWYFGMFFALVGFGSQKVFICFLYFCALIYSVSWFCLFCFSFVLGCFVVWSSLVIFGFFLNIIICLFFACMFSLMIGQYTILNVKNICD